MPLRRILSFLLLAVSPLIAAGQTVADRLRELDRLRDEGIISEAVYEKQWNQVLEDALESPPPPSYPSVPKLIMPKPEMKWEIMLSGSWLSLDAGETEAEMYNLDASIAYRLTGNFDFVVGVDHISAEIDGDDFEATGANAGFDFNLSPPGAGIVPYIGAGVSWLYFDAEGYDDDDDWAWEVHAGFRQYIGDRVVIKYQATYQDFIDLDLDGLAATIGIGVRF